MLGATIGRMTSRRLAAAHRTQAVAQHMMSTTTASNPAESEVLFDSNMSVRRYILNRPSKLNALTLSVLDKLRAQIEAWNTSDLCGTIVGTGVGRAFCAGGDVAGIVLALESETTRSHAVQFFKHEFELNYILGHLSKPYIVLMDGITMGGGVGLSVHAPFRIATENTNFAMPETKIGYCPDVGASYFLSRMDGELGTYLALTAAGLKGRHVFEHGIATHYIPSSRIPQLLAHLSALDNPTLGQVDRTIEELFQEREANEPPTPLIGPVRTALDAAFGYDQVEHIIDHLRILATGSDESIVRWAEQTISDLEQRSPTSLKVALQAIRLGKHMPVKNCLEMELGIATAFCRGASPDFRTGVKAVVIGKSADRPAWSPSTVNDVRSEEITRNFFSRESPFLSEVPSLSIPGPFLEVQGQAPSRYALPTEKDIGVVVRGSASTSAGTGLTLDELVSQFDRKHNGKHGVKEKVLEVVQRGCDFVDNADENYQWLKWRH